MSFSLEQQRHSAAHVMAAAIQRIFPQAKFGVGPVIEYGFYYDVDVDVSLTTEDLARIEDMMKVIRKENPAFLREELAIDEAITKFETMGQTYKAELLHDLKTKGTTAVKDAGETFESVEHVSLYTTGSFVDLCRGPHVDHADDIGAVKLTKIAGAYWRGKDTNPQLQRVYGLCFASQEELDAHVKMMEEAEKRDHRKLGAELDLFTFSPLVGSGLPMFTSKGVALREAVTNFVWDLMKPYGYERVWIPHITKSDLYKTSGHWDKFEDDLFHVSSKKTDETFVLKPMNCPHHTQIYASKPRSYRDLPIRMSEVTTVYRDENTGQLQGLSRVRSITQDDAHVFCRPDQIRDESLAMYRIAEAFYAAFGMNFHRVRLSVRDLGKPENYLGADEAWTSAEATLAELMQSVGREVEIGEGEAAFYGPKLDFMAKDAIGREWQLATIQLDFNQPARFGLEYTDMDGQKKQPIMIHRAILGSVERFLAVLIEHYAGAFPLWLAPVQLTVLSVADRFADATHEVATWLKSEGFRVEIDDSSESVGKKIRKAEQMKIPVALVVGEKEASGQPFTVRVRGEQEQYTLDRAALVTFLRARVEGKK